MEDIAFYLDLDGVMADYDAGIRAMGFTPDPELNQSSALISGTGNAKKREMYEAIKGTDYYANLPLLPLAVEIYQKVEIYRPVILTAAPKFGATEEDYYVNPHWLGAAYHKRWWVEHTLLPMVMHQNIGMGGGLLPKSRVPIEDDRFICTTSSRKQEFMHRKHSPKQVLIDDRPSNIKAWAEAGGIGVLHKTTEPQATLQYIDEIIAGEMWTVPSPGGGLTAGLE